MVLVWWFGQNLPNLSNFYNIIMVIKQVNFKLASDEGELWIIIGIKPACFLKLFWNSYGMFRDFIVKKSVQLRDRSVSSQNWRNLYGIVSFQNFFCIYITICTTLHHFSMWFTRAWVICTYVTMTSRLFSGLTSVIYFQLWIWHSLCMRIYEVIKIISYTKWFGVRIRIVKS